MLSIPNPFRNWLRIDRTDVPLGKRGEDAARRYLQRRGVKIVGQNEQVGGGEIDLIGVHRGTVVFIEVKTRTDHAKGHPAEAVDERKQKQLTQLALRFMKQNGLLETPARFDVVAVTWPEGKKRPIIEHLPNAFEPVGRWQLYS